MDSFLKINQMSDLHKKLAMCNGEMLTSSRIAFQLSFKQQTWRKGWRSPNFNERI